jgi:hypothetical protein
LAAGAIPVRPYCVDADFYLTQDRRVAKPPFVRVVGRDPGRDFALLACAAEIADLDFELVV